MVVQRGNYVLTGAGIIYLILSIIAIFNAFYYERPYQVFWFCYAGMFLIGIGLLGHEKALVQSQLYLFLIPDLVWTLDFASYFIQGETILGITDYFFEPAPLSAKIVSLTHIATIPLGLYFFYHRGVIRKPYYLATWLQLALIYFITRWATDAHENVNCVYAPCGAITLPGVYSAWWFALSFIMVYVTHVIVLKIMPSRAALPD